MADNYFGNLARAVGAGLTFNTADEMEAFVRALAQGDPARYRALKNQINENYGRWAEANPKADLAAQLGGALIPGVAGMFVPGGQAATASTAARFGGALARAGRAMAEPVTVAMERFAPRGAAAFSRFAPGVSPFADEMLTGAIQSAGGADTLSDIPENVVGDLPANAAFSLGVRGLNEGAKKVRDLAVARRSRRKVK